MDTCLTAADKKGLHTVNNVKTVKMLSYSRKKYSSGLHDPGCKQILNKIIFNSAGYTYLCISRIRINIIFCDTVPLKACAKDVNKLVLTPRGLITPGD